MSIRAKTKRRLLILMACTITASALLTVFVVLRVQAQAEQVRENKRIGYEAFEAGDWQVALVNLNRYVREYPTDVDARYKLAIAREMKVEPTNRHIQEAALLFNSVLELDYTHEGAQNHLLDLYRKARWPKEGLALADRVLKRDPKHVEALKTRAFSHAMSRDDKAALASALEAAKLAPADLETQMLVLESMSRLNTPGDEILKYTQSLKEQSPDDPRSDLLVGLGHLLNGKRLEAIESYRRAAAADPPNEEFVEALTRQFDALNLFRDSLDLLTKSADKINSEAVRINYIRRLFEADRNEDVLTALTESNEDLDSRLLGLRAICLARVGKAAEADAARKVLVARTRRDPVARGWEYLVNVTLDKPNPSPTATQVIEAMRTATQADPTNPYIYSMSARAWFSMSETDKAIEAWTAAAQRAPAWAEPYIGLAQARQTAKELRHAAAAWQNAYQRAPHNAMAAIGFAEAMAELIRSDQVPNRERAADEIAKLLAQVQTQQPGEPATLATYVDMLAIAGKKSEAGAFLAGVLSDPKAMERLPQQTLLRLIDVNDRHGFELGDVLTERLEQKHGDSPVFVLSQAVAQARDDRAGAIAAMRAKVEQHPDDIAWQLQWARFLDAIEEPGALAIWRSLSSGYPDRSDIQQLVLASPSAQEDPALLEAAIEKMKKATNGQGNAWKIARARYLLTQTQTDAAAQEAINLIQPMTQRAGGRVEPFVLLATAYQRVGNNVAAIEQLGIAQQIEPDNVNIKLQLIRLRLALGALAEARRLIDAVEASRDVSPAVRRQIAAVLVDLGEIDRAESILKELGVGAHGDLVLARIHLRRNEAAKAEEQFLKLMAATPNLAVLREYALFLRAVGRNEEAVQTLARIKKLELPEGYAELTLAEHYQRINDAKRALEYFREAAAFDRTRDTAYQQMIQIHLDQGEAELALAINDEARRKSPGDRVYTLIQSHRALIERTLDRPLLMPMVSAIIASPEYQDAAIHVLELADRSVKEKTEVGATLLRVRQVADKNPQFLALQLLMVDWYLAAGNLDDAARIATRTMTAFPSNSEAARRAAFAFAKMNRWGESLDAANQWRERAPAQAYQADIAIATAHVNSNRAQQAITQLEPYRVAALNNADEYADWMHVYCRALIAVGSVADAQGLLKPLILKARGWRELWMNLALNAIPDAKIGAEWLETLTRALPSDALIEQVRLGEAWLSLGRRGGVKAHRDLGMKILKHLYETAKTDKIAVAMVYAVSAHHEGDVKTAAAAYRSVIEQEPNNVMALNNLAMIYVESGEELDAALRHAEVVVAASPNNALFLDTLGQVRMARKEWDQAVAAMQSAVDNDPKNTEWRIKLAKAEIGRGGFDAARNQVREVKRQLLGGEALRSDLKAEFDSIESELQKQAAAGN